MTHPAVLATRYARRPLLLEPHAARQLLNHLAENDPRGMRTEGRLNAVLRKIGLKGERSPLRAMDQEDEGDARGARKPVAYSPLWAQQTYGDPNAEGFGWALYDGIALMNINTALDANGEYYCGEWFHGYDTILAASREALADSRVTGLFVRMDCPGGVVSGGLEALATFWRQNRAAAGGKPIHVYADQSCSAAYHFNANADFISAPPVGFVGSIGAVWLHVSEQGALAKEGLEITPIQFGEQKTAGAWWEALSPEAKADIQADVDQCGRNFVASVAAGRPKLTAEALIATQARVFMAEHDDPTRSGLALGFVDAIETEEEAFQRLLARVKTPPTFATAPQTLPLTGETAQSRAVAQKEAAVPQALKNVSPKAQARAAERVRLQSRLAQISAEAPEGGDAAPAEQSDAADTQATAETDPCPVCDGTGNVDSGVCPACEGTGVDPDAGPDAETPAEPPADDPVDAQAQAAAQRDAILGSEEAKTNPSAALAAIRDGLTLAQFRGQLEAHASAPRGGALRQAMANARRLGPDKAMAEPGAAATSPLLADARNRAEAARSPRR